MEKIIIVHFDDNFAEMEFSWRKAFNGLGQEIPSSFQELGIDEKKLLETSYWFPGCAPSAGGFDPDVNYIGTVDEFDGILGKVIGVTCSGYIVIETM